MIREIVNSIYPMSDKSIMEIEDLVEYESYDQGHTFISKGRSNSKEYFLMKGICKSYLFNQEGEEITLSFFKEKSVISPNTIRTKNQLSLVNIKSLVKVEVGVMNAIKFSELIRDNLEIRNFANQVLRNELIEKMDKEIGLASLSAKERLISFREKYPFFENLIPHTDIASYLGITNVSLSRLRKEIF